MRDLINIKYIKFIGIIFLTALWIACDDDLTDLDRDSRRVTREQLEVDAKDVELLFQNIFRNIYVHLPTWQYQVQQNLNADSYSGYMTPPRPFQNGSNNTHYNLVSGWNGFIWDPPYSIVMAEAKSIEDLTREERPEFYALSQLLKVTTMHRVADVFGPIVYTKFGESATISEYDSQEEAYKAFFEDIEEAFQILSRDDIISSNKANNLDLVYQGDYTKWLRFANSLRLRLAIRISKSNPELAQSEAQKSLNNEFGLIESNDQNFIIQTGLAHPLFTTSVLFEDTRMNASMESFLLGYKDPRIEIYFDRVADPALDSGSGYKGIRIGIPLLERYQGEPDQKAAYVGFSNISTNVMPNAVQLMTASEVAFLKAEASLRGWSNFGGTQENYEMGIRLSFEQRGISSGATEYINDTASTPMNYTDPINPEFSIDALSNATIAWNMADDNELKLEKIITQKWIALFPQGQEAWSEYRRTGYPKIFPVASNQSGGIIDTDTQIRRIPFVDSEIASNPDGVAEARILLNGPDNGGTRLWWDVPGGNF